MTTEHFESAKRFDAEYFGSNCTGDEFATALAAFLASRDAEKDRVIAELRGELDKTEQDARSMYVVFKDIRAVVKYAGRHISIEQLVAVFAPLRWEGEGAPPKWNDPLVKAEAALKSSDLAWRDRVEQLKAELAAMTLRRDDLQRGCNGLNGKYEDARLKYERLKAELAALRAPVVDEDVQWALSGRIHIQSAEVEGWTKCAREECDCAARAFDVLARSLRATTAALREAEENLKASEMGQENLRRCLTEAEEKIAADKERIDMAKFLVRGGDKDGALSVLRGGPLSAEKKS